MLEILLLGDQQPALALCGLVKCSSSCVHGGKAQEWKNLPTEEVSVAINWANLLP